MTAPHIEGYVNVPWAEAREGDMFRHERDHSEATHFNITHIDADDNVSWVTEGNPTQGMWSLAIGRRERSGYYLYRPVPALGAIGDRASHSNVMVGSVVARDGTLYRTITELTNSDSFRYAEERERGLWSMNYTIISHPTTHSAQTQENTTMTTNTLGAIGAVATSDNVMVGTLINYHSGTYRLTAQQTDNCWSCVHVSGARSLSSGRVDATVHLNGSVQIHSHPGSEPQPVVGVNTVQQDFDILAAELVAEARRRNWCEDYDAYVRNVNRRTTTLKLQPLRRNVKVSFQLRIEDGSLTDEQIRQAVRDHANGRLIRGDVLIDNEDAD